MPVRVLIVDEHQAVREGLRVLFAGRGVEVAAAVGSAAEALQVMGTGEVDLVLLDLRLPDVSGLVALQQMKAARPNLPVLIHTSFDATQYSLRSLQMGASGFLRKGDRGEQLVAAVRYVAQGGELWKPSELERAAGLAKRKVLDEHSSPPQSNAPAQFRSWVDSIGLDRDAANRVGI